MVTKEPFISRDFIFNEKVFPFNTDQQNLYMHPLPSIDEAARHVVLTFNQAIKSDHWIKAMNAELDALEENGTWEIFDLPAGKQAIGSKWLYKTKYNPDGAIERYKYRLVILGCRKVYGIDFSDTFAPVAKLTTGRALLAVAAMQDWTVCQMDVRNAFLNGDLDEVVYMKMPPGYEGMGSRITAESQSNSGANLKKVCRLKKALYGL